jgi:hypothetical protein
MIPCERNEITLDIPPSEEDYTDRHFTTDWDLCVAFQDHHVPGEYSFDENDIDTKTILPIVTKRLPELTFENGGFRVCHLKYLLHVILHIIHDGPLLEGAEYLLDRYLQGWHYEFSLPPAKRSKHDIYLCETTYLILLGMGFENEYLVGAFEDLLLRGEQESRYYHDLLGSGETRFGSILRPLVRKRFSILYTEEERDGIFEDISEGDEGWEMLRGMRGVMENPLNKMLLY